MKKRYVILPLFLLLTLPLSGCADDKTTSLSLIYAAAATLSCVLLIGLLFTVRQDRRWFVLLFSSVLVVNVGYTWLSVSANLTSALWANRLSYLGSVLLPLSMLIIILKATNTSYQKRLPSILFAIAAVMFAVAASPGVLPVYYREVSFAVINGVSVLVKVYGPLHPLYLAYLLGYFTAMVVVIVRAGLRKTIDSTSHAVVLAIAVFVNIGVWFIEQLSTIDFEFLSVSYIISELFLLGVHMVMNENQRLRQIVQQVETAQHYTVEDSAAEAMLETPLADKVVTPEHVDYFVAGLSQLTPTERAVYEAHVARVTTNEILANLNIKETTLKYHNRNLYGKLGVSGRKELLEMHKHLKSLKITVEKAEYEA